MSLPSQSLMGPAALCLVVLRLRPTEQTSDIRAAATQVLDVLATTSGFCAGWLSQAIDDPTLWSLTTEWDDVGSYRRAIANADVRVTMMSALTGLVDEPSAFEVRERRGSNDVSAGSARQIP